jgi:glycosyltransferase involved in cell wall biosynthesis
LISFGFWFNPEDVALARSADAIEELSIARPLIERIGSTCSSCAEVSHHALPYHSVVYGAQQAVARAMEYLLSHDAEAEAMGRRGRQAACELYNWNSEERVLLKFYSQLLETQVPEKGKQDKKASPSATDLGRGLNVSTRARYRA